MSTKNNYKKTHIHWFRTDLRISDHEILSNLEGVENFLAVYILDPRQTSYTTYGFRKMGLKRLQFLRESLNDLQQNLREKGNDLIILGGLPEVLLPKLVIKHSATLSFQEEYATEERAVESELKKAIAKSDIISFEDGFLIHPNQLPKELSKFPESFSSFRTKIEKKLDNKTFELQETKTLPKSPVTEKAIKNNKQTKDNRTAFPFSGGENSARQRLLNYLFETREIDQYKTKRNGLIGSDYSSKFSPWLANGNISPKQIMHEIRRYEAEFGANDGTYWLWFELLWRDFFRYIGKVHGERIFYKSGILNKAVSYKNQPQLIARFSEARTFDTFINANIIELQKTGFMSNRGRQNVASYLIHDLHIDWRFGAALYEHHLLDYDVYSNQGNWMYIAGVGNDPKGGRKFDVKWQAQNYDPKNEYTELWTTN